MNSKRQTIWLVSMLSLMVLLSAYYLFTEDVNDLDLSAPNLPQEDIDVTNTNVDPTAHDHATDQGEGLAGLTDEEVLQYLESGYGAGDDYFVYQQMQRDEKFSRELEEWLAGMTEGKSPDEIARAAEEYERVSTMQAKVEYIEEELGKDFRNVVVLPEGKNVKVVVQADKLERSQAVSIMDLVMAELGVAKDYISVQVRP